MTVSYLFILGAARARTFHFSYTLSKQLALSPMDASASQLLLIKYIITQTILVPSLVCDLFVFVYFIRRWRTQIINAPKNHVIFCMLTVSFVQKILSMPAILFYFRWGIVLVPSDAFCTIWTWLDYSLLCTCLHLLAWCCIERHLLVFHSRMMKKYWCLLALHYVPLAVCLLYISLFYAVVILFPTACYNTWDYTILLCGGACYAFLPTLGTFDGLFHTGAPVALIIVVNGALYWRVVWQKIKQQQPIQWRQQRRMIIQIGFISSVFLVAFVPLSAVTIIQAVWSRDFASAVQYDYFYYLPYFGNLLLPFVIISSLPKLRSELGESLMRIKLLCFNQVRVRPIGGAIAVDTQNRTNTLT